MTFKDNKAIYLQIADLICDHVLTGKLPVDGKIPSVRETAATVEVNANTVARSYEYLQNQGVIYTKRGLGYFVAPEAKDVIMNLRRDQLLGGDVQDLFRQLSTIGITPEELRSMYQKFLKSKRL